VDYLYDARGFLERVTSPQDATTAPVCPSATAPATVYTRDNLGRVTKVEQPTVAGTAVTTISHKGLETVATEDGQDVTVDGAPSKQIRTTLLDGVGRVVESRTGAPDGGTSGALVTRYRYGALGLATRVERLGGAATVVTTMSYDKLGRRLVVEDPDTGRAETTYNAYSDVITETAPGIARTYTPDVLGRTEKIVDGDGETRFTWDTGDKARGKLVEVKSPSGVVKRFSYDGLGRRRWPAARRTRRAEPTTTTADWTC
jgi:YD repeat-containing protein